MSRWSMMLISMVILVVAALAFGGGFYTGHNSNTPAVSAGPGVFDEAWSYLKKDYVEPARLTSDNISAAAIKGILEAINDPHMAYISARDYDIIQSQFQGSFDGIGAVVGIRDDKLTISSVVKGAPAEAAGIKSGDVILEINGESAVGMSTDVAVSKIRGQAGTKVELSILHEGETEPVKITVTRARIDVPSVDFEMKDDIAIISIYQFTSRTETELAQAMPKLKENNAKGIVLDLRDDPGGILGIVIQVASHFITDGVIVSVRSNQGVVETYRAEKTDLTTDLPMVVLVNENSASGSEVLSGALQDHKRAVIAGTTTYGKGSVNILQKLSDGSGIYITTSRWLTPDGRMIEGNGIEPDIQLDVTGDEEIQWAVDYLHGTK